MAAASFQDEHSHNNTDDDIVKDEYPSALTADSEMGNAAVETPLQQHHPQAAQEAAASTEDDPPKPQHHNQHHVHYEESERLAELKGYLPEQGKMQYDIPTLQQAEHTAEEHDGVNSLQARVLVFLQMQSVQWGLAGLLLLDVIVLFVELALLTLYPTCHTVKRDAISCCPDPHYDSSSSSSKYDDGHRFLGGGGGDICDYPLVAMDTEHYEAGCDDHKWHRVHRAEEFLFGITMFVLFTFLVELLVMMWAIRPAVFFRQFFFVLDFAIVTISIALELTFHVMEDDSLAAMVGLLILGRVWRFVRIGHGIVEITTHSARKKYEELIDYTQFLEMLLQDHGIEIPEERRPEDYTTMGLKPSVRSVPKKLANEAKEELLEHRGHYHHHHGDDEDHHRHDNNGNNNKEQNDKAKHPTKMDTTSESSGSN